MTTWARDIGNRAIDVVIIDPRTIFPGWLAEQFIIVPDDVQNGWVYDPVTQTWTAPPSQSPIAMPHPTLTPMQFYLAFTPTERIAIKGSADEEVKEFWATYELAAQLNQSIDPNLVSVVEGLTYLATATNATPPGAGILASTNRIAQIQSGIPQ